MSPDWDGDQETKPVNSFDSDGITVAVDPVHHREVVQRNGVDDEGLEILIRADENPPATYVQLNGAGCVKSLRPTPDLVAPFGWLTPTTATRIAPNTYRANDLAAFLGLNGHGQVFGDLAAALAPVP